MNCVFPSYAFKIEFFDEMAELVRPYVLTFHCEKDEIELYDMRNRRTFLRRTTAHTIHRKDLYVGNKLLINGRQYEVADFADESTSRAFDTKMQRTYAMLKPGFQSRLGEALGRIAQAGLKVSQLRMGFLSRGTAAKFYGEHQGKPFYDTLVSYITSGPIVALELLGNGAIQRWRDLLGPTNLDVARRDSPRSLRALFARSTTENYAHGSDSPDSAARELGIIFGERAVTLACAPDACTCAVVRPHAVRDGSAGRIVQDIVAAGFAITGARIAHLDLAAAGEFVEVYNGVVADHGDMVQELASGPCLALELARGADTVQAFRELCGPRDSAVAKQIRPESLRAKYGSGIVHNAVHCTDLLEDAPLESEFFFALLD